MCKVSGPANGRDTLTAEESARVFIRASDRMALYSTAETFLSQTGLDANEFEEFILTLKGMIGAKATVLERLMATRWLLEYGVRIGEALHELSPRIEHWPNSLLVVRRFPGNSFLVLPDGVDPGGHAQRYWLADA